MKLIMKMIDCIWLYDCMIVWLWLWLWLHFHSLCTCSFTSCSCVDSVVAKKFLHIVRPLNWVMIPWWIVMASDDDVSIINQSSSHIFSNCASFYFHLFSNTVIINIFYISDSKLYTLSSFFASLSSLTWID